jgi:hypothetical protein
MTNLRKLSPIRNTSSQRPASPSLSSNPCVRSRGLRSPTCPIA